MFSMGPKTDQVLACKECGKTFIFSAAGQEFYQEQGFREPPKRCKSCREKNRRDGQGGRQNSQGKHSAVCWSCQKTVLVPFKPVPGRPVYCRICYTTQKRQGRY